MFEVAIGHSEIPDEKLGIDDCLQQCRKTLGDLSPQAGLLFAFAGFDYQKIISEILKVYPNIEIAGCSSFGEISSTLGISQNSIALMLFSSDEITFRSGLSKEISNQEIPVAYKTVKEALEGWSVLPSYCSLFADGLTSNVSDYIEGLKKYFGEKDVDISGGAACDEWEFKKVYLFNEQEVASNAASMLIFSKPLVTSTAVRHGRTPLPLSQRHIVTKSSKNVVYTIDNKPAFDFYRETLGENANYEAYALLVFPEDPINNPDNYLVRAAFKINKEDGSITFPGDVKENSYIGISQHSTQKKTLEAAQICTRQAIKTFEGKQIKAALVFSCALRKEILGTTVSKEFDLIKQELPEGVPIFGYCTYGEIGPFNAKESANYYNETIVVTLIGI